MDRRIEHVQFDLRAASALPNYTIESRRRMAHESLRIFLSYSHVDYEWQRKITAELELLGINVWVDRQIKPGDTWQSEIEESLASADIILLLISRDFLTSDFVTTQELPAALERVRSEQYPPRVIPVLLRETTWKKLFGLEDIHAIPRFERWIANIGTGDKFWPNEDAAIRAVAKELEEVVAEVEAEKEQRRAVEADYRMRVAEALADDDEISPYERRSLEEERARLGLAEPLAAEIEATEKRRHEAELDKVRAFEAEIEFAINDVGLPFDAKTQEELKKRKAKLGLKDEDVEGLVERVAARLETTGPTDAPPPRPISSEAGSTDVPVSPSEPDLTVATAEAGQTRPSWEVGQRAFARWAADGFSYPGTIVGRSGAGFEVKFDDGAEATVSADELAAIELAVGARVSARWDGGAAYFPGHVRTRDGESIVVVFDDGVEESTTLSMTRIERP